jgi:hypothetical protein
VYAPIHAHTTAGIIVGADRLSPTAIFTDANIDWNLRGFAIESHSLNRGDPILIAYHMQTMNKFQRPGRNSR